MHQQQQVLSLRLLFYKSKYHSNNSTNNSKKSSTSTTTSTNNRITSSNAPLDTTTSSQSNNNNNNNNNSYITTGSTIHHRHYWIILVILLIIATTLSFSLLSVRCYYTQHKPITTTTTNKITSTILTAITKTTTSSLFITTTTSTTQRFVSSSLPILLQQQRWFLFLSPVSAAGWILNNRNYSNNHHHNHYHQNQQQKQQKQQQQQQQRPKAFFTTSRNTEPKNIIQQMSTTTSTTTTTTNSDGENTNTIMNDKKVSFRESLQRRIINTWVQQLDMETDENYHKSLLESRLSHTTNTNQTKRQVYNGHYVIVEPKPLLNPKLILYSTNVAINLLGFTNEQIVETDDDTTDNNSKVNDFIRFVSGNVQDINIGPYTSNTIPGWATPYALSIMGTRYYNNCPYNTGNAYGDGRAISIAEISTTSSSSNNNDIDTNHDIIQSSYEIQLKGGGTTPFHRGADGRAVLRSSIREFLASEAMYYLHVPTTRALALVVSTSEYIQRPWYKEQLVDNNNPLDGGRQQQQQRATRSNIPTMDDPRLASYSIEQRKQIINQIRRQNKEDPNILIREPCAITTRVCNSFIRIGHLDLFARRAYGMTPGSSSNNNKKLSKFNTESLAWKEIEKLIWHTCYREYRTDAYVPYVESNDIGNAGTVLLQQSAIKLANMVAQWIRVGFAQGNFNADNCLVGGYTMDYGPFGFMEEYDPLFAKWTGSGQHFGFLNQPSAAFANYGILVESVVPVIAVAQNIVDYETLQNEFLQNAQTIFQNKMDEVFRIKLGFRSDDTTAADDIWEALEPLLRTTRVDYTLFFRELSYIVRDVPNFLVDETIDTNDLLTKLIGSDSVRDGSSPFYEELTPELHTKWIQWIEMWYSALVESYKSTTTSSTSIVKDDIVQQMLQNNPKYVLREWMLVEAYQKATHDDDESELLALYNLIQHPYEEGRAYEIEKYYRRAPEEALVTGGTAFMS